MYIASFKKFVYSSWKILIISLKIEKATIFMKYLNFTNIFSSNFVIALPIYFKINNYPIVLKKDKKLFYKLTYTPKLVEILKTYIKTNFKKI